MTLLQKPESWDDNCIENEQRCVEKRPYIQDNIVPRVEPTGYLNACHICQLLEPPWPIRIHVDTLFESPQSKCPGCVFLCTILYSHVKNPNNVLYKIISIDIVNNEMVLELRTVGVSVRPISFVVWALEGMSASQEHGKSVHSNNIPFSITMPMVQHTKMSHESRSRGYLCCRRCY
jgi:hypothetical protein